MKDFLNISLGDLLTILTMVATIAWVAGRLRAEIAQLSLRIDGIEAHLSSLTEKMDAGVDKMADVLMQLALHQQRIATLESRLDGRITIRRRRG